MRLGLAGLFALVLVACREDDDGDDGAADTTGGEASTETGDATSGDDTGSTSDAADSGDTTGVGDIVCDESPVITYDTFGAGFLATYCNGCHGGQVVDRKGAPPEVVFDTREQASAFADRILARRMPPEGTMPMPPAGGVTLEDDVRLHIWLTCHP